MLKFYLLLITCVSLGIANTSSASDRPVAGEVVKYEKSEPFAQMEPQKNVTDILSLDNSDEEQEPDIYFSADELVNDEKNQTLEALGDVVIKRENLTVYADRLIYKQAEDKIMAVGNVRLEEGGNTVYSDNVELSDKMNKAEMNRIKVILRDETKIWADQFRKKANGNKIMSRAVYTPCDFCEESESPLWRLRARKVTHSAESKDINYNDTILEVKGVPVFYLPFLSHPDPSVKRRSGFLAPNIGSSNYLGGTLQLKYFWDVNEHTNILFAPIFTTDKNIVLAGGYKQYFNKGYVSMEGSYLRDSDNDVPNKHRGNLVGYGRYELGDKWVADTNINYVSDELYLKEMDLDGDDDAWLTSNVRFQRFDGRDYSSIEAYYYKLISYNLRLRDNAALTRSKNNKPLVLPLMDHEILSKPNSFGGYWKNNFNYASVYHEDDAQTHRLSMINSWNLPWTSPYGERYRVVASLKSDAYYIDKNRPVGSLDDYSGEVVRVFPQLGVEWKLPFVKATENSRQIIEPVIVGVLAPNGGNKSDKIPNEDSEDIELDDTNVLDLDRYAGYDRNDTGSRISYGLNWSSYGNIIGRTSAFIAQTYQFNKRSSFTRGIENEGHFTDYVGRIYAAPADYLDLDYRFRLDRKSLKPQYSELGARIGTNLLNVYVSYIYLQKNKNSSEMFDERKELYTSLNAALTRDWSLSIYNRQDLTEQTGGSLEHGGNLIYEDECFKFITTVKKYNSIDPSLDDGYEFNFTFYFKTIGGIGA